MRRAATAGWGWCGQWRESCSRPRPGVVNHAGTHRVQDERACACSPRALSCNHHTLVPALQQVSNALMTSRKMLGIDVVQPPHPLYQIAVGCFDAQVVMIIHAALGIASPALLSDCASTCVEKDLAIRQVEQDSLPGVAACRQVIQGAWECSA